MLIGAGAILDTGHVYWDVRLGTSYDTLEFRIADACPRIDDAGLPAGPCRALVLTCMREIEQGRPVIDVPVKESVPARDMVDHLIAETAATFAMPGASA
jgi:gamma-glutamyl:cysteine ligase YbdK (ATP-grasp superfamily)